MLVMERNGDHLPSEEDKLSNAQFHRQPNKMAALNNLD
jgi:hypothetical protein